MTTIFYDLETTGLARNSKIIEIAAYREDTNTYFHELVNPGIPIPPGSSKIHKITDPDVVSMPKIKEVLLQFNNFCQGENIILIAHNNDGFDKIILQNEYIFSKISLPSWDYLDTLKIARAVLPELGNHKLDTLKEYYDINIGDAHLALDDVANMYQVYQKLKGDKTDLDMFNLSKNYIMKKMPFGKHRGILVKDLPDDYVDWMKKNLLDDPGKSDIKLALEYYGKI